MRYVIHKPQFPKDENGNLCWDKFDPRTDAYKKEIEKEAKRLEEEDRKWAQGRLDKDVADFLKRDLAFCKVQAESRKERPYDIYMRMEIIEGILEKMKPSIEDYNEMMDIR